MMPIKACGESACRRVRHADRLRRTGKLEEIAGWVAPAATMIAAMMTAANLGARVTGWGFVVFTAGSVAWSIIGVSTGQTNLVASNAFLTLVNLVGIWRWLGRQRVYEAGAETAETASRRVSSPDLFTATGIAGMTVIDRSGVEIGKAVEALVECASGQVSYVVVATGGVGGAGEELRAVRRDAVRFARDRLHLAFDKAELCALAPLDGDEWPGNPQGAAA